MSSVTTRFKNPEPAESNISNTPNIETFNKKSVNQTLPRPQTPDPLKKIPAVDSIILPKRSQTPDPLKSKKASYSSKEGKSAKKTAVVATKAGTFIQSSPTVSGGDTLDLQDGLKKTLHNAIKVRLSEIQPLIFMLTKNKTLIFQNNEHLTSLSKAIEQASDDDFLAVATFMEEYTTNIPKNTSEKTKEILIDLKKNYFFRRFKLTLENLQAPTYDQRIFERELTFLEITRSIATAEKNIFNKQTHREDTAPDKEKLRKLKQKREIWVLKLRYPTQLSMIEEKITAIESSQDKIENPEEKDDLYNGYLKKEYSDFYNEKYQGNIEKEIQSKVDALKKSQRVETPIEKVFKELWKFIETTDFAKRENGISLIKKILEDTQAFINGKMEGKILLSKEQILKILCSDYLLKLCENNKTFEDLVTKCKDSLEKRLKIIYSKQLLSTLCSKDPIIKENTYSKENFKNVLTYSIPWLLPPDQVLEYILTQLNPSKEEKKQEPKQLTPLQKKGFIKTGLFIIDTFPIENEKIRDAFLALPESSEKISHNSKLHPSNSNNTAKASSSPAVSFSEVIATIMTKFKNEKDISKNSDVIATIMTKLKNEKDISKNVKSFGKSLINLTCTYLSEISLKDFEEKSVDKLASDAPSYLKEWLQYPNLIKFSTLNDRISKFFAITILSFNDKEEQKHCINFFIKVAVYCLYHLDFNSAYQIYAALSSAPIQRLLDESITDQKDFQELEFALADNGNFVTSFLNEIYSVDDKSSKNSKKKNAKNDDDSKIKKNNLKNAILSGEKGKNICAIPQFNYLRTTFSFIGEFLASSLTSEGFIDTARLAALGNASRSFLKAKDYMKNNSTFQNTSNINNIDWQKELAPILELTPEEYAQFADDVLFAKSCEIKKSSLDPLSMTCDPETYKKFSDIVKEKWKKLPDTLKKNEPTPTLSSSTSQNSVSLLANTSISNNNG